MTVPTACRVDPVKDCLRDDGWDEAEDDGRAAAAAAIVGGGGATGADPVRVDSEAEEAEVVTPQPRSNPVLAGRPASNPGGPEGVVLTI